MPNKPRIKSQALPTERPSGCGIASPMNTSRNRRAIVLLVEDEVLIRWATAGVLREAGFEVLDVESADAALPILEGRSDIGVLFTDINMPGEMNGQALAYEVHRRWPSVRLLVTSGDIRTREPLLPLGSRFLAKPYSDVDLIAGVDALAVIPPAPSRSSIGQFESRALEMTSFAQPRWGSR
jgi:CheY-like chemotaxis protein